MSAAEQTEEKISRSPCQGEHDDCDDPCRKPEHKHHYFLREPCYAADVGAGYHQTKAGIYYKAQAATQTGNCSDHVFFVLENPRNSGVNIFINKIVLANLSDTPLQIVSYLCGTVKDDIMLSYNVHNTNTYFCCDKPAGKVYSGKNLNIHSEGSDFLLVASSYQTLMGTPSGSILLAPGKCYIAKVTPLQSKEFKCACSFAWWEEDAHPHCPCKCEQEQKPSGCGVCGQ